MGDLEKLLAIEEIRKLKARRVRCMDEKDWAGYAACHTPNAVSYTFQSENTGADAPIVGNHAIAERLKAQLTGRTTVHHIHAPEIELTSETTARAIWPMEDMLWWEEDGRQVWLHGYGHYRETYEKVGGEWLIASRALSRIRVDRGEQSQKDVMHASAAE
jgi:hypothetical protein